MIIITTLYCLSIYLVFHKFKLLPWNKASKTISLVLGVIILCAFLVGLQGLTPASAQADQPREDQTRPKAATSPARRIVSWKPSAIPTIATCSGGVSGPRS